MIIKFPPLFNLRGNAWVSNAGFPEAAYSFFVFRNGGGMLPQPSILRARHSSIPLKG